MSSIDISTSSTIVSSTFSLAYSSSLAFCFNA
nr:MAG TPA_asm: hypothetical protein [Caudoviricetes sp.]